MENLYDLGINLLLVINGSKSPVIIDLDTFNYSVNAEDKMRDPNVLENTSLIFVYCEKAKSRSGLCISIRRTPGYGWYLVLFLGIDIYHRSITDTKGADELYQVENSWTKLLLLSNQLDFNISNFIVDNLWTNSSTKALSARQGASLSNLINSVDSKFYNEITTIDKYYDDGSGLLVPVRHPDLSTQPSILPYKFMGLYVYEQLIPADNYDDVYLDIGRLEVSNPIFLSVVAIQKDGFSGTDAVCVVEDNRIKCLMNSAPVGTIMYYRIVYTSMPEEGDYYGYNNY